MNVAFYVLVFDHATDCLLKSLGLGPNYVEQEKKSVFQLECHLSYQQEVTENDMLDFTIQLLDYDSKRIHFFTSMYQRNEGFLSATAEWIGMHIDLVHRRSAIMPAFTLKKLYTLRTLHKGLPIPKQVGRIIGIKR